MNYVQALFLTYCMSVCLLTRLIIWALTENMYFTVSLKSSYLSGKVLLIYQSYSNVTSNLMLSLTSFVIMRGFLFCIDRISQFFVLSLGLSYFSYFTVKTVHMSVSSTPLCHPRRKMTLPTYPCIPLHAAV